MWGGGGGGGLFIFDIKGVFDGLGLAKWRISCPRVNPITGKQIHRGELSLLYFSGMTTCSFSCKVETGFTSVWNGFMSPHYTWFHPNRFHSVSPETFRRVGFKWFRYI